MADKEISTVEQYIAQFPPQRQAVMNQIREVIRRVAPEAQERIRWGMPTYWQGENLVHFAAAKQHIGFYPSPEAIEHFAPQLSGYKSTKGAVQFPDAQPMPYDLIEEITRWRVKAAQQKKGGV